ncbi:MAG TPA: class II aldolase/adducin family protein [Vicinamibacterales bacterium]|nr:class II aldolase/adducin family protein [Vicinamibacterales bacterium]
MTLGRNAQARIVLAVIVSGALLLGSAPSAVVPPLSAQQAPASAGRPDPALIEDLVAANRILHQQGVNDAFGHVSVRHNSDPNRFFLARSLSPDLVTAEDLIEYDLESAPVDLKGREQYSERFIHSEIYKARPDVRAVVHNHSQDVIPFSVSTVRLRPVFHVASFLQDGVPVFDIRKCCGITDMLVTNSERGRGLAQALGDQAAVLMRGHGVTVVGPSLPYAVGRSVYLSFNARVQAQAMALGGPVTYLDPAEAKAYLERGESRGYERPWEAWKRQATGK